MKCVVCNTSFCWICCAIIDDTVFPEHFQVQCASNVQPLPDACKIMSTAC